MNKYTFKVAEFVEDCLKYEDMQELLDANAQIVRAVKHLRDRKTLLMRVAFEKGDRVCFTDKHGSTYEGSIVKTSEKRAKVSIDGRMWKVPYSMLRKV